MFREYSYKARNGATAKLAASIEGHSMLFLALKIINQLVVDLSDRLT